MSATRAVTVRYRAAAPETEGPVTLGQDNMLRCLGNEQPSREKNEPSSLNKQASWIVPEGADLARCLDALRTLAERHAALRTVFRGPDGGLPEVQRQLQEGEFTVEVIPLGPDEDASARADAFCWDSRCHPFDLAADFPLRLGLLTRDGRPVLLGVVVCHAQLDGVATGLLFQEWLALASGGELPPATGPTPIEVAEQERSTGGRRRARAALRHWKRILDEEPSAVFADDRVRSGDIMLHTLAIRSRAGAEALERAVRRTASSKSAVLSACYAALAAHRAARSTVVMAALSANRHRSVLAEHIGTLAQDALLVLDTDCPDLDTLIGRTQAEALSGYWHATFETERLWEILEDSALRRGARFVRDVVLNDVSGTVPEEIAALRPGPAAEPDLTWYPTEPLPTRLMINIWRTTGCLEISLHAHPDVLDREETEGFALALLRLIDLAGRRNVALGPEGELAELSGLPVGRREKGRWVQVGPNWVDLDAVADRVRAVLAVKDADVSWENGELTATVPTGCALSPTEAHAAMVAALSWRDTVMAPHRYVLPSGTGTGRE
ncbi:condensation domain-containing protein [Streptomyces sp. TLI_171]|uniref:condensation domain-containing protein n=1 Tax=Streptomyces sp. TLI_171 TaxID=1938859 RepID=UPI000C181AAC|nr:condensation domain-containing protein [Streptomyces sp. TLI_171]RKE22675.1 condensation domain-containing protein [Streptomyces sp. TLI_171]